MRDFLVPNPTSSDKEYARFHHLDLPNLDDTQLTDELNYLRAHLWRLPPDHWLRERVKMLEAELAKRRYAGHEVRGQPKLKLAEGVRL